MPFLDLLGCPRAHTQLLAGSKGHNHLLTLSQEPLEKRLPSDQLWPDRNALLTLSANGDNPAHSRVSWLHPKGLLTTARGRKESEGNQYLPQGTAGGTAAPTGQSQEVKVLRVKARSAAPEVSPQTELRTSPTVGLQRQASEEVTETWELWVGPGSERRGPESRLSGFHRS